MSFLLYCRNWTSGCSARGRRPNSDRRTGEILLQKPTLADERRNVMHYLRDVFPSVLPELDERLQRAWSEAEFRSEDRRNPATKTHAGRRAPQRDALPA